MSGKKTVVLEKKVKDPVSVTPLLTQEMKIFKESVNKEKNAEKIY